MHTPRFSVTTPAAAQSVGDGEVKAQSYEGFQSGFSNSNSAHKLGAGDERSGMEGWKVQKKKLKISFVAVVFFLFSPACLTLTGELLQLAWLDWMGLQPADAD